MENKKRALGKGLEQLFTNNMLDFDAVDNPIVEKVIEENINNITQIDLNEIRSNPYQPRKTFNENSLNELAESIKEYGVVQPVVVKRTIKGYELVAGERRCKASKIAGKTHVPAIIKDFTDDEMMEIALLENIQREDLNPIETAESVEQILKLRGMTQEVFALKFGKSRSYITNLLGILKLPTRVKGYVENKVISLSHARVLSKIDDEETIVSLADRVVKENLSVHDLESLLMERPTKRKKNVDNGSYHIYEKIMSDYFDEKIKITNNKIEIKFSDDEDLQRLLNLMNVKVEEL